MCLMGTKDHTFLHADSEDSDHPRWTQLLVSSSNGTYEPRCEKTGLRGFRPGLTQTGLCSHRRWLEALNFGFRK